jgi:hypothetical protein
MLRTFAHRDMLNPARALSFYGLPFFNPFCTASELRQLLGSFSTTERIHVSLPRTQELKS